MDVSVHDNSLVPTRQTLLERLRNLDDQESWKEFFDTYWRLIFCTALRAGLRPEEAEDVVQDTIFSVSKSIPGFKYDRRLGSFKGWLLQTTHWRIRDQFRKRDKLACLSDQPMGQVHEGSVPPEVETIWEDEWCSNLLSVALDRVKARCDSKHFQAFQLSFQEEWPIKKVAATLNITIPRLYLIKHRLSKILVEELQKLQKQCE